MDSQLTTAALPKLEYEQRPEWTHMAYPWHLDPSDELDEAWDDLLYGKYHDMLTLNLE